jgi:hypothetical protein
MKERRRPWQVELLEELIDRGEEIMMLSRRRSRRLIASGSTG